MSVSRRIYSLLIATSLLSGFFFVFFPGQVIAAENDHNLSGIVWRSDGSVPTEFTDYCIWVEHGPGSNIWYRFPATGWRQTQQGVDGYWYYMYVLPYAQKDITWSDGDIYRVQVDGTPWDDAFGNTTSNGTGSLGDPFPTPYDPQNPSNFNNYINYSIGGGEINEQQWDVRTTAQVDLAPIEVKGYGNRPEDNPFGIPVPPSTTINITFKIANYGSSDAGAFDVSIWTCSRTYVNDIEVSTFSVGGVTGGGETTEYSVNWVSPSSPGDYYLNITADSGGVIAEFDESNNRYRMQESPGVYKPLHFIIGPELILTNVLVMGQSPIATIDVGKGSWVTINAQAMNVGFSATSATFIISLYNITGPGGEIIPGHQAFNYTLSSLGPGATSGQQTWSWYSGDIENTDYYVNITVDYGNDTWESNENNNDYTIHFYIPPWPVTAISRGTPSYTPPIPHNDKWYINTQTPINLSVTGSYDIYTHYNISGVTPGWVNYTGDSHFTIALEGLFDIQYYSINSIGSTEPIKTKTVIVDDNPPVTSFIIGDDKYREYGDVWNITSTTNFSFSAVELPSGVNSVGLTNAAGLYGIPESGIYYRIRNLSAAVDVVPLTEYTPGTQLYLTGGDGYYRIFFNSTDNLMQVEPENYVDVYLDNSPPEITLIGGQTNYDPVKNKYLIDFSIFFNFTVDDGLGSGVDYVEYNIQKDDTSYVGWQTYTGTSFNLTEGDHGFGNITIFFRARDNLGFLGASESLNFYIEGDQTPPLPPLLSLQKSGNTIILEWEPSMDAQSQDVHHYLIYRSPTKKGFDFETPWVNTATMDDNGGIPLRTTWNDTNVLTVSAEYYYAIRGVDALDNTGYPSNIVGWVTMTFYSGYNTFALPLEPFSEIRVTDILRDDAFTNEKDTVYMFDTQKQMWIGHPKFLPASMNNFTINMGEGYMIFVVEDSVDYTFLGSSAVAIRFMDGPGSDAEFRDSLDIDMDGDNAVLTWENDETATGYKVFRGEARRGAGSLTDYENLEPIADLGLDDTYYRDANLTGNEHYYMVVAENGAQNAGSTYSMGVRFYEFGGGYSSFSFELDQEMDLDTVGLFATTSLDSDSDTIFYYDRQAGIWQGHPKFLPENINTGNVVTGVAYLIFTNNESAKFAIVGV
jgi:hypothetical protein